MSPQMGWFHRERFGWPQSVPKSPLQNALLGGSRFGSVRWLWIVRVRDTAEEMVHGGNHPMTYVWWDATSYMSWIVKQNPQVSLANYTARTSPASGVTKQPLMRLTQKMVHHQGLDKSKKHETSVYLPSNCDLLWRVIWPSKTKEQMSSNCMGNQLGWPLKHLVNEFQFATFTETSCGIQSA